jgi:IclR family acetate operon transcriptional repressor
MANNWTAPTADERKQIAGTALIAKACDVLDLIGSHPGHADQAMLARETQIPRATLYRILAALSGRSLIRNDPATQSFMLGFRFLELAQNVWSSADLASIASTELRRLRDMTGETAYLAVQQDRHVLALGRFDGAHSKRSNARLGALKPMYCTSQGKAILAHLSEAQVSTILSGELTPLTPKTITNSAQLIAQLAIIRARGYSIDDEEILEGTRCVGAAILDDRGRPVAAISVAGPAYRVTPERAEQLGQEIAEAARRISSQIAPILEHGDGVRRSADVASRISAFRGADPAWDALTGSLIWTDQLAPALNVRNGDDQTSSLEILGSSVECSVLGEHGTILFSGDRTVLVRDSGGIETIASMHSGHVTAAAVSPKGEIWVAVASGDGADTSVLRYGAPKEEPGFALQGNVESLTFAPDGATLYAALPERGTIYALTVEGRRRRVFANVPKVSGQPAALAVDEAGRVWVAMSEGWSVVRLDENGEFDRTHAIPVPHPTGLAFGGTELDQLYITSSRSDLSREALKNAPLSGHLLSIDVSTTGYAPPRAKFKWPSGATRL